MKASLGSLPFEGVSMIEQLSIFFASMPSWLGTIPGWLTSVGTLGILGILTRTQVANRRITVDEAKIEGELDDRLRAHFAGELNRLRQEINSAKEDVHAAKERQTQCEEREHKLRLRVRKLEDQLTGIVRSLSVEGSLRILDITEHPSDDIIRAAISSLENIIAKRNGDRK